MARTKVVSYSEIDSYRQCPLKHQLSYVENWRLPDQHPDQSPALSRGTLFHSVMEAHYGLLKKSVEEGWRADINGEDLFLAVAPLLYRQGTGEQTEEQELVEWMYRGYVDLYHGDRDWEIIAVELPLEAWLPTETGTRSSFKLAGTTDLLIRDNSAGGGLYIVDHKTCRNLPKQKDFDMEDQTALYTLLLRSQGYDIRGAIYNHVRTEKLKTREMAPEERFKRTLTVRGERELQTMALEALDEMREAYKPRTRDARRRPDGERCGWKCGYTEACLAGRKDPKALRPFLEDVGFVQHDTKPGPTFQARAKRGK